MVTPLTVVAAALVALLAGLALRISRRRPSNDRDWSPDVARLATGEVAGDTLTIHNLRDTRYGPPGTPYQVRWTTRSYHLSALRRLWLAVESFGRLPVVAHTFLSFEFADDHYLSVSVEARLTAGERYSIARGLARAFEVAYTFGDERDFILRRAAYKERSVLLLPLVTHPVEARALLLRMVATANELAEEPRFYHSIAENCTTTLVDHANEVRPGSFPLLLPAKIMPGLAPATLYRKGWIDTDVPAEALARHFDIGERARALGPVPDFSRRLRQGLLPEGRESGSASDRPGARIADQ